MKLIFFLLTLNLLSNDLKDRIKGRWLSSTKKEIIEISNNNKLYKIKISWLKYPKYRDGTIIDGEDFSNREKIDIKNPNKNERDKLILGLCIADDLKYDPKKNMWIGNLYNPNNGKRYYTEIRINGNKLEMKYYVSIFHKKEVWSKER